MKRLTVAPILFIAACILSQATNADDGGEWDVVSETPMPQSSGFDLSTARPVCTPDPRKWTPSSNPDIFIQSEATIVTYEKNSYLRVWVSFLKDADRCVFEKSYYSVDCVTTSIGAKDYSMNPVDPDSVMFDVVKDICIAFPSKPEAPKPATPKRK